MTAITFNHLHKYFGSVHAVNDSHFSIKEGEIFGFLGPNGAGKTTTIRCLMDFIRADRGSIEVFGKDAQQNSVELKKMIGYLSADHHLHDDWTGQEHINFVAAMRNVPATSPLIARFGLDPSVKVRHLSTGNKQKLNIVLAFLGNPKLVILDEPTQGLDPILQNAFYDTVHDYQQSGGTVFMSSHNLAEVERLCDRVAIINKGKIIAQETLASLRSKSIHSVDVLFDGPVTDSLKFGPDITVMSHQPTSLHLRVKGSLNELLKQLTAYKIKDIEITHAHLDEIFLEYYHD